MGFINYWIMCDGEWQGNPASVGQLTDGPMTLGQLGGSLFLVYKERNTRLMRYSSFNVAPFNAFAAVDFQGQPAPLNDTALHSWAPADATVGQFAQKMAAYGNRYQALGPLAAAAIEGELHLVYRGGYPDTPGAHSAFFGLTGVMTAAHPLSNGYGTIAQAGWTPEQPLAGVTIDPDGSLAMTSDGQQLFVAWRVAGTNQVHYCTGGYTADEEPSADKHRTICSR